jgi:hypothetical protein
MIKRSWDYPESSFGRAIVGWEVKKMLDQNILKRWICIKKDSLKDSFKKEFHWIYRSLDGIMQADVCWLLTDKKGYIQFSIANNNEYGRNVRGKFIKKPENPEQIYREMYTALYNITEYFTKEEYNEILSKDDPFEYILSKF